jgi:peptide/nickel transport system ATP-binding protein
VIEVEGLDVVFGRGRDSVHAVREVSFRVAEGESFGLVGESGSGKSTVLRALCGLNPNWSGRITVDGRDLAPKRDKAFFKLMQMVFQDPCRWCSRIPMARCIRATPWTASSRSRSPSTA